MTYHFTVSVTYESLKLSWHSCCHLNFFELALIPAKKLKHPAIYP